MDNFKIFKTIHIKVVCYFTVIFQKQRHSKWRSLHPICKKERYCGVDSKVWFRRHSLFWRKGQTTATAHLRWWGTVFLMFYLWQGERCFFLNRLQIVPIKGQIVFCTLQNLIMPTKFTVYSVSHFSISFHIKMLTLISLFYTI